MPYVSCPRCGLQTFSVARWTTVDHCVRCGGELPRLERARAGNATPLVGSIDRPGRRDESPALPDAVAWRSTRQRA